MAVIQYSGLVSQVRGKIAGTVFSKFSTGFNAYKKPVPRKLKTSAQLQVMAGMSTNASTWNLLSPEEKEDWASIAAANPVTDRLGNLVYLTGYHFYRMILAKVWPRGLATPLIPAPMAGGAQEIDFVVSDLEFDQQDEGTIISLLDIAGVTINSVSGDMRVLVWISLPIASLESNYFGTYYLVEIREVSGSGGSGLDVFILIEDVLMPLGFYTFQGGIHKVKLQYIRPESGAVGVEKFATKLGVLEPVVVFPTFDWPADPGEQQFTLLGGGLASWVMAWTWTVSTPNWADFEILIQWADAQIGTAPVDEGDWGDLIVSGITSTGAGTYIYPGFQTAPRYAGDPYVAEFGIPGGLSPTWYIPIRARLRDIATSQEGPWQNNFSEITSI